MGTTGVEVGTKTGAGGGAVVLVVVSPVGAVGTLRSNPGPLFPVSSFDLLLWA